MWSDTAKMTEHNEASRRFNEAEDKRREEQEKKDAPEKERMAKANELSRRAEAEAARSAIIRRGDNVLAFSKSESFIWLIADGKDWDLVTKLALARDVVGLTQLESQGRMFSVDNGSQLLVIGIGFEAHEVRVMSGPKFGKSGWALITDLRK